MPAASARCSAPRTQPSDSLGGSRTGAKRGAGAMRPPHCSQVTPMAGAGGERRQLALERPGRKLSRSRARGPSTQRGKVNGKKKKNQKKEKKKKKERKVSTHQPKVVVGFSLSLGQGPDRFSVFGDVIPSRRKKPFLPQLSCFTNASNIRSGAAKRQSHLAFLGFFFFHNHISPRE